MLELTGIPAASPIGYMAALGLLRVLNEDLDLDAALSWTQGAAVLHGIERREALLNALSAHMKDRAKAFEWNWAPTAKGITAEQYATACLEAADDHRALGFLAGFGTDGVLNDDGAIRTTRLDLTSGRQKLIADLRKLAIALKAQAKARMAFETACFGGEYEDQSTFNWDPVSVRKHALEHQAPTKSSPPGKPGLVWLAAESLSLHPVLPAGRWTRTTGCERIDGAGEAYFWGLWSETKLQIHEARFLRALDHSALKRRPGIQALWASQFAKSGKYGILLPAKRLMTG